MSSPHWYSEMQTARKRQHQLDGWQDDISAKRPAPRRFEGSSPGTLAQSNALEMEFSEERRSFSLPSATGITCNPDVPMADATTIPDWSDRVCYGAVGFVPFHPPDTTEYGLWQFTAVEKPFCILAHVEIKSTDQLYLQ